MVSFILRSLKFDGIMMYELYSLIGWILAASVWCTFLVVIATDDTFDDSSTTEDANVSFDFLQNYKYSKKIILFKLVNFLIF